MIRTIVVALTGLVAAIALAVPAMAHPLGGNGAWKASPSCYIAKSGDCVESPDGNASDATAICGDGSDSHSESRSGTCSRHGGVAQWCPCGGSAQADPVAPNDGDTAQNVGSVSNSLDATFYDLLTHPDQDDPQTVFDFPLLVRQAHIACQLMDNGLSGVDVIHQLEAAGPYSFDDANTIVSSANVAYCPWNKNY